MKFVFNLQVFIGCHIGLVKVVPVGTLNEMDIYSQTAREHRPLKELWIQKDTGQEVHPPECTIICGREEDIQEAHEENIFI